MTDLPADAAQMPDATPSGGSPLATTDGLLQSCRICRHEFRVPPRLIGKKVPCSHCGTLVEIVAPTSASDPLIGKRIGNCRLTYRLGAGGIGLVYAADQLSMGRAVAIKMLGAKAGANEVLVQRFQRESKLAAQINHPNVVHVYDCGFDRGVHFQLMELVEGGTLASLVDEHVRLPWREAADLALQIARALQHIHGLDIIHRDIKPANILIGTDQHGRRLAKLADLGLAKQLDAETDAGNGLTMEGKPLGSPAFMPPEQVRNAKDATVRSDLYGVGATFYAAITGYRPFDGRTSYEVMANVLTKEIVPPGVTATDLPPAFNDLILRCLAKDPARRPASAEALAGELERLLAAHGEQPAAAPKVSTNSWRRPQAGGDPGAKPPSSSWRRPASEPPAPAQAPSAPASASWKRPPAPAVPAASAPPASGGMSGAALGVLIALGVAIVVLLAILVLKK
jgi:serine/threonine protein kinase